MAVLTIRTYPDPVLTERTAEVTEFTPALAKLIEDMAETMYFDDGIGLAANQVGEPVRVFVMDVAAGDDAPSNFRAVVNPVIVAREGETAIEEGCLSFPGLLVKVPRSEKVTVRAADAQGNPYEFSAVGLEAICVQHELDHLDGIVFVDRLSPIKRRFALKEYLRLSREAQEEEE